MQIQGSIEVHDKRLCAICLFEYARQNDLWLIVAARKSIFHRLRLRSCLVGKGRDYDYYSKEGEDRIGEICGFLVSRRWHVPYLRLVFVKKHDEFCPLSNWVTGRKHFDFLNVIGEREVCSIDPLDDELYVYSQYEFYDSLSHYLTACAR
jgi:hypothetical protein